MSEPRLISSYLAVLAAQLPAPIVEELADGLTETHRSGQAHHLGHDPRTRWRLPTVRSRDTHR